MGRDRRVIVSSSAEETLAIGRELGRTHAHGILCFFGDMGSGKTTLIKGIVEGAVDLPASEVTSPTFTLLHVYEERVYHFDLYRLETAEEFTTRGFEEYLETDGLCLLEWSEKIAPLLPKHTAITLKHLGKDQREITICS